MKWEKETANNLPIAQKSQAFQTCIFYVSCVPLVMSLYEFLFDVCGHKKMSSFPKVDGYMDKEQEINPVDGLHLRE